MTANGKPPTNAEKYRKGQRTVHFWVNEAVKDEWLAFAENYGQSLKDFLVAAAARHMKFPPPLPALAPPLTPLPDGVPKRKRG